MITTLRHTLSSLEPSFLLIHYLTIISKYVFTTSKKVNFKNSLKNKQSRLPVWDLLITYDKYITNRAPISLSLGFSIPGLRKGPSFREFLLAFYEITRQQAVTKMLEQEDPELTSSPKHSKTTTTYKATLSENYQNIHRTVFL